MAGRRQVVQVASNGSIRPLLKGIRTDAALATSHGSRLVVAQEVGQNGPTDLRILDVKGHVERRVRLQGSHRLVNLVAPHQVLLTGGTGHEYQSKLLNPRTGWVTNVHGQYAYGGGSGYATVTNAAGTYMKPCVEVLRLSRKVGSSCAWAPTVFSPGGRYAVAVPTLSEEDLGPAALRLVKPASPDRAIATFRVNSTRTPVSFLGDVAWEDDEHFLLAIHRDAPALDTVVVRCDTAGACERATEPIPAAKGMWPRLAFGPRQPR